MSKFDYMGFGYDGGSDDMFVAHAKKYSAAEAVEICKQENDYLIEERELREPTIADVQEAYCAFRFGVSEEWPDGCYTFVGKGEPGAFPVWVIDYGKLR